MSTTHPDPLSLLAPGALLGGPLFRSLAASTRAPRLPAGTRLGPFRIEAEIGAGGMGVVYRARRDDGQFEQTVAIKCVARAGAARESELFARERQVLASLRHPNIARLLDGGRHDDGQLWFAMELVEGAAIDAHARAAQLDAPARLRLLQQVVDAVAFAHARLLLHRDLKPANVLIDADGSVKLLDFGIAALAGDDTAARAYSPGWASPEQLSGGVVGPASDQYQLGLLLDVLLRGDGAEPDAHRGIDPARWAVPPGLRRAELAAIAARSTREEPSERYGSVREFGDELGRWLEHRPVRAHGSGLGYVLRCAVGRHPWIAASATGALLLLIALTAGFSWRLAQERDAARRAAAIAEAVNGFVNQDLLAQADPYSGARSDLSMREALDRARLGVGARFAGEPEIEAAVRATLARAYAGVGETDAARTQMDRAIALVADAPSVAPDTRLDLRIERAGYDAVAGNYDAAFAAFAALRTEAVADHGETSAPVFEIDLRVVEAMTQRGADDAVPPRGEALLARLDDRLDPDGAQRLRILMLLGDSTSRLGRRDEARRHLQAALDLAGDDPSLAVRRGRVLQTMAYVERESGNLEAAIALQRRIVAEREAHFGRAHGETLGGLNELASILQDARQYAEAEALFREVLRVREASLGIGSPLTRNSLNNLGLVLSLQDKLDEAEGYYRRALDAERAALGDDALDVLILAHNLAGLLRKRGLLAQALALHADTVDRAQRTLGADRAEPALFRVGMAQTLQRMRRWDAADAEFVRAREQLARTAGTDSPRVARIDQMREALRAEREAVGR
jgi:tetratricopeptide (TPR) repeat protein